MKTKEQDQNKRKDTPRIENSFSLSLDGKWLIQKVTITSFKPVAYIKKMLENQKDENFPSIKTDL